MIDLRFQCHANLIDEPIHLVLSEKCIWSSHTDQTCNEIKARFMIWYVEIDYDGSVDCSGMAFIFV